MILGKAELHFRTEHAFGLDSADRRGLQRHRSSSFPLPGRARQRRAARDFRQRRGNSGACIGRAAYNLEMASGAGVYFTQIQTVGVLGWRSTRSTFAMTVREGWRDMLMPRRSSPAIVKRRLSSSRSRLIVTVS